MTDSLPPQAPRLARQFLQSSEYLITSEWSPEFGEFGEFGDAQKFSTIAGVKKLALARRAGNLAHSCLFKDLGQGAGHFCFFGLIIFDERVCWSLTHRQSVWVLIITLWHYHIINRVWTNFGIFFFGRIEIFWTVRSPKGPKGVTLSRDTLPTSKTRQNNRTIESVAMWLI